MKKKEVDSSAEFERALADAKAQVYVLRLYVSGATPKSAEAIRNIKRICEEHLDGHYELEVIDIYQQPGKVAGGQIVAAPTLVKELPPPLRKLIGNLSQTGQTLERLGVEVRANEDTNEGGDSERTGRRG